MYRLVSRHVALTSPRRILAAAVGGYVGLNAAALATGIELGIQPDLFHDAAGAPLYSPYHLAQSIPAMLLAHLAVAGFAEAILCAAVVGYLQRANLPLLRINHPGVPAAGAAVAADQARRRRLRPGVLALGVMAVLVLLSPLGLLAHGTAFGEDAPEDLPGKVPGLTAVPEGLAHYSGFWQRTLLPDYNLAMTAHPVVGYYVSAVVGILVVGLAIYLLGMLIVRLGGRRVVDRVEPAKADTP
jgi:cobalt/nickel transport system permease protein